MRSSRGFTIIEVMIVVAIVAILAAVAIPQYTDYVTRANIQEGTAALLGQRVKMEQYFQDQRTYVNACNAGTVATPPSGLKNFSITCANLSATTYTVRATGFNAMAGWTYTIDQGNNRVTELAPAAWINAALPISCWITKKKSC